MSIFTVALMPFWAAHLHTKKGTDHAGSNKMMKQEQKMLIERHLASAALKQ